MKVRINKKLVFVGFVSAVSFLSSCGGIVTDTEGTFSGEMFDGKSITASIRVPKVIDWIGSNSSDVAKWSDQMIVISGEGWTCNTGESSEDLEDNQIGLVCDNKVTGWVEPLGFGNGMYFELTDGKSGLLEPHFLTNVARNLI